MKTKTVYRVIKSVQYADGNPFTSYGIKGETVCFEDVSADRQRVEEMVVRINREELEESQLLYFINDELDR